MITSIAARESREDANLLRWMMKGCQVGIVGKNGKQKPRMLYVDDQTGVLRKTSIGLLTTDGTKTVVALSQVGNVIDGSQAERFSDETLEEFRDRIFILYADHGRRRLEFVCHNATTKWAWVRGLTLLVAKMTSASPLHSSEEIVNSHFHLADADKDGLCSVEEAQIALRRLHLPLESMFVPIVFSMINRDRKFNHPIKNNRIDQSQFVRIVKIISDCPELRAAFELIKGASFNNVINALKLTAFLHHFQNQRSADRSFIGEVVRKYELSFTLRGSDCLSYEGFRAFLLSDDNSVQAPETWTSVYQDMTKPLSQYWIVSAPLLRGERTGGINGVANALQRGCRYIEIDTWDGHDDEPMVTHGHTLADRLTFRDVLCVIREEAFARTAFPLIIGLENHCTVSQQRRMTHHLNTILGKFLCASAIDPAQRLQLLSPQSLSRKILIKSRVAAGQAALNQPLFVQTSFSADSLNRPPSGHQTNLRYGGSLSRGKIIGQELSQMVALISTALPKFSHQHFSRDQERFDNFPVNGVSTLLESEATCLMEDKSQWRQLRDHTSRHLVKVSCGNYSPLPGLLGGCQLATIDVEKTDRNYNIYSAFLRDNGRCGYVLKPPSKSPPLRFRLQIIAGYQLCSPTRAAVNPYILLMSDGIAEDRFTFRTAAVRNNGFSPIWNEAFEFQINRPNNAILRFIAMDARDSSSDHFIGQYTLPVRLCRPGIRNVRLDWDFPGASSLLVHLAVQQKT